MGNLGRPSTFTDAVAEEICARLGQGEPLAQICRDAHMPGVQTFRDWMAKDAELSVRFAQARADGFDRIALDALEIADDGSRDYKKDADGRYVPDHDHINRSKLRVETRLKLLAKWDPKRYGDRVQTEHSGGVTLATIIENSYRLPRDE